MTRLAFDIFRGTAPLIAPRSLSPGFAVSADNCDFRRGRLEALPGLGQASALTQAGALASIYPFGSANWLAWPGLVQVVRLPVTAGNGRIALTGVGYPKQTDNTLAVPGLYRRLGVKPPTTPLTVGIISDPGEGEPDAEFLATVSYTYTMITAWGEESAPGPLTGVFSVNHGQTTRLTGFAQEADTGNDYTHYRIYRLDASESAAEYLWLTDIPITEDEYDDTILTAAGPDALQTTGWEPPPDDADGIIQYHDVTVIWRDQDLLLSPLRAPYAYPQRQRHQTPENIAGVGWFGETLVVVTTDREYRFHGKDPNYMTRENLPYSRGCVSPRSMVSSPAGVFYASADGLVLSGDAGSPLVTTGLYTPEQWSALTPANLIGFFWRGGYLGFFAGTNRGIHVTADGSQVMPVTLPTGTMVRGGHHNLTTDTIYLLIQAGSAYSVQPWAANYQTLLTSSWLSAPWRTTPDTALSVGKIIADPGSSIIRVLVDTDEVFSEPVEHNQIFRLPITATGLEWQIARIGTVPIDKIILATSTEELE